MSIGGWKLCDEIPVGDGGLTEGDWLEGARKAEGGG